MPRSTGLLRNISMFLSLLSRVIPRKFRWIIIAALVVITVVSYFNSNSSTSTPPPSIPTSTPTIVAGSYLVTKVIDGDTLQVNISGQTYTVRLIGVDTPEVVDPRQPVQCFGQEASNKAKELALNQTVRLESDSTQTDRDVYGRLLRYAYLPDGTHLNLQLITQGYAFEYTFRTPYQHQTEFKLAQQQAWEKDLGLWSPNTCDGKRIKSEVGN